MAIKTQSDTEIDVMTSEELETLQAILAAQGESVSYKEVADIGYELLGFFEALGEENISDEHEDGHV